MSEERGQQQCRTFFDAIKPLIPRSCDALLDFGCGVGRLAPYISPMVVSYHGVDIVEAALEEAPKPANAVYTHLNGDTIPYIDDYFDCAMAITVLQHIVDDKQLALWAGEMHRVVKPGGAFVIVDSNRKPGAKECGHVRSRAAGTVAEALGAKVVSVDTVDADGPGSHWAMLAAPL